MHTILFLSAPTVSLDRSVQGCKLTFSAFPKSTIPVGFVTGLYVSLTPWAYGMLAHLTARLDNIVTGAEICGFAVNDTECRTPPC
jgi:hypothetical protein